MDLDKELCACFIDWQKAFEHINWTKFIHILKGTDIHWCKRRVIRKLYMGQSIRLELVQWETRSGKIGRGVRQGCCLLPILFSLYSRYLTKEAFEGFGYCKIRGQVFHTVKYVDNLVLLAEEEVVLQVIIERLIEIRRCYRMEMTVEELT